MRRNETALKIEDKIIPVSNLKKVLYPDAGFTKQDVIDYYLGIADVLLPHVRDRALTMKRYPNGVNEPFFYEKRCPSHKPSWLRQMKHEINYCLANERAALVWLSQMASVEIHTLLSKQDDLNKPTMMVFDLDPGEGVTIEDCIPIAMRVRDTLSAVGLRSYPKTSGSKGIHVYVPLWSEVTFDFTKAFAHGFAEWMSRSNFGKVTANMRKQERVGKVFIDWSQNDGHKTTVAPYSLRARSRPTVSTPLTWDEVRKGTSKTLHFEAEDVIKRVQDKGDVFAEVLHHVQTLPRVDWEHRPAKR